MRNLSLSLCVRPSARCSPILEVAFFPDPRKYLTVCLMQRFIVTKENFTILGAKR